jgi:SCY1-like protein 2
MAVLRVFKQVGEVADSDYLAMKVLPLLWQFSLGPLLNLQQFQAFMLLIKTMSSKIEREQTRKLQEMGSSYTGNAIGTRAASARAGGMSATTSGLGNGEETGARLSHREAQTRRHSMPNQPPTRHPLSPGRLLHQHPHKQ